MEHLRREVFGTALPARLRRDHRRADGAAALPRAERPADPHGHGARPDGPRRPRPPRHERAHRRRPRPADASTRFAFDKSDPLLGAPTVTATLIEGGTAKNVVPDRCTFTLDVRSTPAYTHADLAALFRDTLESEVAVYSDRLVPCRTAPDARIARAAGSALTDLGLDAEPFGSPTASDWVFVHDVPAVKLGPGRSELSHTADEHVEIDQLTRAVEVYRQIIRHYFAR